MINWQQQGEECWEKGNYKKAVSFYEEAIAANPNHKNYYWQLGLAYLLQGQETEAQTAWLLGMSDGEEEEVELWSEELTQVLTKEASARAGAEDYSTAWLIRQHIREITPLDINNLLHLLDLSIALEDYTSDFLSDCGIIDLLQNNIDSNIANIDRNLLLHFLKKLLNYDPINRLSIDFASAAIPQVKKSTLTLELLPTIYRIAYSFAQLNVAKDYAELLLNILPEDKELLRTMSQFSGQLGDSLLALEYAEKSYALSKTLHEKIISNHLVGKSQMELRGCDRQAKEVIETQESLLHDLVEEKPTELGGIAIRLYNSTFLFPYARDLPEKNLEIRSKIARLAGDNLEKLNNDRVALYRQRHRDLRLSGLEKTLRIGYLSHCLRRHSVGWIARWLLKYHNREKFEVYGYLLGAEDRLDPLQEWYRRQCTESRVYELGNVEVGEDIYEDKIDILIDLDSITLTNSCSILAMKPAPVQATWLGWDASEIPTIDYFIADPYVLPENAENYYAEKIWRLPQTYLAVDGFETSTRSIRRNDLGIPDDGVVYYTAQRGYKYNQDTTRLQMKIIKEVPNSYFLFKKFEKSEALWEILAEIASSEGVSSDRLIAIPKVALEEIHRANLDIIDVVLDTYPYNGATTTLETLWNAIPIVTKVGQQFAARNSYTMMVNAGIFEGIAWTDEEYVEWGIRLGRDENLRKQVSWKLRQSKRSAPLWNARKFAREMERAYQQMWQIYVDGGE